MLAQTHARKPAPPLAARGMWLRLGVGADAFGSALGDSVVESIRNRDGQQPAGAVFNWDDSDMDGEAHKDWNAFSRDSQARGAAGDAQRSASLAALKAPVAPDPYMQDEPIEFFNKDSGLCTPGNTDAVDMAPSTGPTRSAASRQRFAESQKPSDQQLWDKMRVGAWSEYTALPASAARVSSRPTVSTDTSQPSQSIAVALAGGFATLDNSLPPEVSSGYSGPIRPIANAVASAITQDNDVKISGALYAGFGGGAEGTIKFNLIKGSLALTEFEAGLGLGVGGELGVSWKKMMTPGNPGADSSFDFARKEWKGGTEQSNGTIAVSVKGGAELQLGPFVGAIDGKVGWQSNIGGSGTDSFAGRQAQIKVVSGVGISAQTKVDLFNWTYKKK